MLTQWSLINVGIQGTKLTGMAFITTCSIIFSNVWDDQLQMVLLTRWSLSEIYIFCTPDYSIRNWKPQLLATSKYLLAIYNIDFYVWKIDYNAWIYTYHAIQPLHMYTLPSPDISTYNKTCDMYMHAMHTIPLFL